MFTESTPSSIKDVKTYTSLEATSLVTKTNVKCEILVKDLRVSKFTFFFSFKHFLPSFSQLKSKHFLNVKNNHLSLRNFLITF